MPAPLSSDYEAELSALKKGGNDVVAELIRAAQPNADESQAVTALSARIRDLEAQLELAEEDAEKRIRALAQEMEAVRL